MWKATLVGLAALCWVAVATPVRADVPATLQLKSGERISGELVDYGGSGFTIKVNGAERQVPANDVAVVEFSGQAQPDAALQSRLASGQQVIVLRNGQQIQGTLYDLSGTQPLNVVVNTAGGQQTFSSNEVAQIYLANPSGASASMAAPSTVGTAGQTMAAPAGAIAVPANQQWTPTNLTVKKGQNVYWQTTGQITLSTNGSDIANAAGAESRRTAANAPIPNEPVGALIAKVGPNGQPFPIGTDQRTTMPADGQLYLGINDDFVGDNSGQFIVQARIGK